MQVYEGQEKYIFVSYAHKDSEEVIPVIEAMAEQGFRIWYDSGIEAGTEWPEYIETHLMNSACVLAFMSSNAIASKNCRNEINFALNKGIDVLVVYLEDTELTHGMGLQLESSQSLFKDRHDDDESFLSELFVAPILWPCNIRSEDTPAPPDDLSRNKKRKRSAKKKKKQKLSPLSICLIIALLATVFVVAQTTHFHSRGDWFVETEPGFDAEGSIYRVCATCGGRYASKSIPALKIDYTVNEADKTCTINKISQEDYSNWKLHNVVIPDQYRGYTVTEIAPGAFDELGELASITFPSTITTIHTICSISDYDFSSTKSTITSVIIPEGVTTIGERAFKDCPYLISITYNGTMAEWKAIEKGEGWKDNTGNFVVHCTDGDIAKADS